MKIFYSKDQIFAGLTIKCHTCPAGYYLEQTPITTLKIIKNLIE